MSKHKNNENKTSGASDVIRYLISMAIGLFTAGAGFGGCVVCSVARGCSWTIGLPSLIVVFVGAVTFTLGAINLVDAMQPGKEEE